MAKSNANTSASAIQTNSVELDSFVSLRDLGYKQARVSGILESQAKYAMDKIPNFPLEKMEKKYRDELSQGYQLRYSEMYPNTEYAIIDGNYLPVSELSEESKDAKLERVTIGIDYIMSFSTQQWGSFRTSKDPQLAKLWVRFNPRRIAFSDYCTRRIGDLVTKAKSLIAESEGKSRDRTATKAFGDYVSESFETFKTRCKTAHIQRGDVTANTKLLDEAIAAFNAVWLKG
jgi:hypothetical protein